MRNIRTIATIVVRVLAVSFLTSALIELAIIATDFLLVKAEIYRRSEIAFVPRLMFAAFAIIAAAYLFYQSKPLILFITDDLVDENLVQELPITEGEEPRD